MCAVEITKILATAFGPSPAKTEEVAFSSNGLCRSHTVSKIQRQEGYDKTLYDVYYDFSGGQEQVDGRACGREIWTTPDKKHPSFGTKFVYLVDGSKKRVSDRLYLENSDGSLRPE